MMNATTISCLVALALAMLPSLASAQDKPAETEKAAAQKVEAAPDKVAVAVAPKAVEHPFVAMAGSWSGGGTISLSGGTRERLRCRANHAIGKDHKSLTLNIRCASDSHRFDLSSSVVERRGQIFGRWTETSNNVSGSINGRAVGNRIQAVAQSDSFSAGLSVSTDGNRQSVSITPQGVFITGVHIALCKR